MKDKKEEPLPKYDWKRIFCWIGLHKWRMTPVYMLRKCEICGKEKVEHYYH